MKCVTYQKYLYDSYDMPVLELIYSKINTLVKIYCRDHYLLTQNL